MKDHADQKIDIIVITEQWVVSLTLSPSVFCFVFLFLFFVFVFLFSFLCDRFI